LATSFSNIGAAYDTVRDEQTALQYYNKALPLQIAASDKHGQGITLRNIGVVYDKLNEKQKALDYYNQALPLLRAVGDKQLVEEVLGQISEIQHEIRDLNAKP
jgi:tetratricopeptide (TPR) repeat protein